MKTREFKNCKRDIEFLTNHLIKKIGVQKFFDNAKLLKKFSKENPKKVAREMIAYVGLTQENIQIQFYDWKNLGKPKGRKTRAFMDFLWSHSTRTNYMPLLINDSDLGVFDCIKREINGKSKKFYKIYMNKKTLNDPLEFLSVFAHELTHVFLEVINYKYRYKELAVDIASHLIGFGTTQMQYHFLLQRKLCAHGQYLIDYNGYLTSISTIRAEETINPHRKFGERIIHYFIRKKLKKEILKNR